MKVNPFITTCFYNYNSIYIGYILPLLIFKPFIDRLIFVNDKISVYRLVSIIN